MGQVSSPRQPIVWLIVLAQLCITLPLAHLLNVWVDEAYTLHTTAAGLVAAARRALAFEMQPPFYFAALGLWRKADPGFFVARLFSVACAAGAIPTAAWTSRRFFAQLHPAWLAAAVAFSPGALWAAVEARPYALSLLLAVALPGLFQAGFLAPKGRRGYRVAYAGLALVALYTQYYLGFLLVANAVALLVLGRYRTLADYVGWMLLVALGFAPLLALVPGQVASHTATSEPVGVGRSLATPLINFEILAFGIEQLPGGRVVRWLYRGVLVALLLAAARGALAERRRPGRSALALVGATAALAACFSALPALYGHWAALSRHTIALLPAGLLLLYGALGAGRSRKPLAGALLLLLAGTGFVVARDFQVRAKQGDHLRVARFIEAEERPGQPILVFPAEQALALAFHYTGRNEVVPLPRPASLERFDPRSFAWQSRDEARAVLGDALGPATECWLLTYGAEQSLDYPLHPELLEAEVSARFATVEQRSFHDGATLRLLRTLEPAGGELPQGAH